MGLEPGDEVHYVAVLDKDLNMLEAQPLRVPFTIPSGAQVESIGCDIHVTVHYQEKTI